MPIEIGSYDAKTKLPEILRRVESGEAFTITNRGKPIADLIPSRTTSGFKTKAAITRLLKMKKALTTDAELISLRETGRK